MKPKIKAHLRVAAQLQDETSTAPDVDEITSEAALHRLASSRPNVTTPRISTGFAASLNGMAPGPFSATAGNRFPESAVTDEDEAFFNRRQSSSESDGEAEASGSNFDEAEMASIGDGDIVGRKERETWLGFREQRGSPGNASFGPRSLGGGGYSNSMETDSPSTSLTSNTATMRPGKRKAMDSERFESYNSMAFKRRAVSPTASLSPHTGSPVLGASGMASAAPSTPIPIPQPRDNGSFFASMSTSRQSSPAPMFQRQNSPFASGPSAILGMMMNQQRSMDADEELSNDGLSEMNL